MAKKADEKHDIKAIRFSTLKVVLPLPLIVSEDRENGENLDFIAGYNKALFKIYENAKTIFKIKVAEISNF